MSAYTQLALTLGAVVVIGCTAALPWIVSRIRSHKATNHTVIVLRHITTFRFPAFPDDEANPVDRCHVAVTASPARWWHRSCVVAAGGAKPSPVHQSNTAPAQRGDPDD